MSCRRAWNYALRVDAPLPGDTFVQHVKYTAMTVLGMKETSVMKDDFRTGVIELLKRAGSDLTKPHEFDFYLYLPSEAVARQAAEKVRASEYAAQVRPSGKGNRWLCLASATIVPENASLSEIGDFFERIAAALDGDFDGWETKVRP